MHKFNSDLLLDYYRMPDFSEKQIKEEPMLFSCDAEFAKENGGPITKEFLSRLAEHWIEDERFIFDSRSHMLMPGFWPCIPGWHHDDVPREREDGQPNYKNPSYSSWHCLALINGDIAPTEFAIGSAEFPEVPLGEKYYKTWHPIVEKYIKEGKLNKLKVESNKLYYFNSESWHKGTKAIKAGWRWFGRASIKTNREVKNEIRTQVQVYVDLEEQGW